MNTKKRVLVVDDEAGVLRFVKTFLSLEGYDVITADNGEEGLQLVETDKPDIVLLDILMVPVSGLNVLRRLREFSTVPVIVFSAKSDSVERAVKEGADSFIAKPFLPDHLLKKIEETLASRKSGT
ncbi:MAG: response regulator [Dehalococcoidales bacterium]|nr:response regulator [Dehalococcoidales bacterium]